MPENGAVDAAIAPVVDEPPSCSTNTSPPSSDGAVLNDSPASAGTGTALESEPTTQRPVRISKLDPNAPPAGPGSEGGALPSRRVYVGNLAWSVTWQALKDHMRKAGEVVFAEVFTERDGRSRGCGVVEYATEADSANAIATLNDTELQGRLIFVREDREPNQPLRRNRPAAFHGGSASPGNRHQDPRARALPPSFPSDKGRKIIVWNLPYSYTWQDLKDEFRACGSIIRADILMDQEGRSRGAGTIVFESEEDAQRAIQMMDRAELAGRIVDVRFDKYA
jgi:RNA recognition motif-containing protein